MPGVRKSLLRFIEVARRGIARARISTLFHHDQRIDLTLTWDKAWRNRLVGLESDTSTKSPFPKVRKTLLSQRLTIGL